MAHREVNESGPPPIPQSQNSPTIASDTVTVEEMRRRMNEALAQKQRGQSGHTPPTDTGKITTPKTTARTGNPGVMSDAYLDSVIGTASTDSARTVKAGGIGTPGPLRTPSYPFPRMQLKLQRGISQRSGPHHKPFTLLSPTNETPTGFESGQPPFPHSSSEQNTPIGDESSHQAILDDPNFPTPDLYDMVLMLNTEPGLESWWANVTEILCEAYGAERASLALPGDVTDLENVPWGQRATFNIYSSDSGDSLAPGSQLESEADLRSSGKLREPMDTSQDLTAMPKRPPLESRHSIAGHALETTNRFGTVRPEGPVRATSYVNAAQFPQSASAVRPRLTRQSPTPQSVPTLEETSNAKDLSGTSVSFSSIPRCHVFGSLQPLEAEPDSLLVRTGVASLFGKRAPIILTRAYSEETAPPSSTTQGITASQHPHGSQHGSDVPQSRSSFFRYGTRSVRAFDEFEQPEPSPWSQSPSPSPAARPDPEESPFFTHQAANAMVDEDAFEQNPPQYDYGATANQSLNAIGTDMSKTLIHIPLIQPVPSRSVMASNLRFPIAILSFTSSVNPYPKNLRLSLSSLLPHLASTFSLAQQFTNLQDRIRGGSSRRSAAFGLGGTFSDEGSELELVSELSSQLQLDRERSKSTNMLGSMYSPSESTTGSKDSMTGSLVGTPLLDHLGMSSGYLGTPGRPGAEAIDSYFSTKRSKSSHQVQTPGKMAQDEAPDRQRKPERSSKSKGSSKKSSGSARGGVEPLTPINTAHGRRGISSGTSEQAHSPQQDPAEMTPSRPLHRDSIVKIENGNPLPELISSLMLNAVPLQLFLAKPSTGDLVWTNRKFDAFRSQGEGRVRDPWKNVHDADKDSLLGSWTEALKSGSQFTHYVRVKRFNSDSDFRWFVFRASTLLSNSGRLLYWVGSFLDIHEQYMRNLEASEKESLMARDAKIRALADAIPQILFEAVEDEGIVSVNQQWHTYSGQTLEEARGLGFARQVHRDDLYKCGVLSPSEVKTRSSLKQSDSSSSGSSSRTAQQPETDTAPKSIFTPDESSLNRMLKQGALVAETDENGRTSYSTEIRLRSKGGEFRWYLIRLVKNQHELLNNGLASWYGTCTDIETRMGLERELNRANKKVHQEMESKTKFFANMSHEIRTPLNGILGSMPWLVESLLDHDQRRTVDTIQNSANNLRELVDNILDVTKVEAGKMTLLPKWFHVRSLCEEVVDTVSSRAIERGLELNYSLDVEVPTMVKGDPFRVRQVLLNLMANSVKFTEQGEIYLRCYLRESDASQKPASALLLAFDVVDTGRGFNESEFKRLFKQFGQIEGASQHESGSGLGLFLSKQLVEMHGGELSVQSKTGEGSTFRFFVQVEKAITGSDATSPALTQRPTHRSSVSHGGRRRSDSRTPTLPASKSVVHTPGLSRYTSPEIQSPGPASPSKISPPLMSPGSSAVSIKSSSGAAVVDSSISSLVPTPESAPGQSKMAVSTTERQPVADSALWNVPNFRRSRSDNDGKAFASELAHPEIYSIVVICPADNARIAIKQHIEHVVPHQIPANVTSLRDIGNFLDLMNGPSPPTFTHIVLDLPASSDIMLFMRQMQRFTANLIPALVVITDHYQKRDIQEDFAMYTSSGRRAFLVHKPVKPSVFAMIFDPAQLRKLSKDRAREVAQTSSDDFKKIANQVKESIGHKSFRVLLVEDSDVNRMVIMRYLRRVGLDSEEARDGQECVDKVTTKSSGYYSLIICDIQMPRKNGYEACSEIRRWEQGNQYRPVPIMALTANAMPEERAAAAAAGFSDYLTKPVDFNRLGMMMMTLLDPETIHVLLRDQVTENDGMMG